MSTLSYAAIASLAGVISHLAIFIQGEWDRHSPSIPKFNTAAELVVLAFVFRQQEQEIWKTAVCFVVLNLGYFFGLFASIGVYRAFFHPLRNFPGPPLAKLRVRSGLSVRRSQISISIEWFMRCIGPMEILCAFVCFPSFLYTGIQDLGDEWAGLLGPREISINNADAIPDIHGPNTACIKKSTTPPIPRSLSR
ncbi:hypothetical protein BDW59DRAFT_155684 [Aspergillus cavernicola]|uniref:Uncharacterized protein n=1 Tax=Aspergillus cavernicola TaxID=176166 RepID=A0ABR4J486_9EURO